MRAFSGEFRAEASHRRRISGIVAAVVIQIVTFVDSPM
jgi:hypothetical protein